MIVSLSTFGSERYWNILNITGNKNKITKPNYFSGDKAYAQCSVVLTPLRVNQLSQDPATRALQTAYNGTHSSVRVGVIEDTFALLKNKVKLSFFRS